MTLSQLSSSRFVATVSLLGLLLAVSTQAAGAASGSGFAVDPILDTVIGQTQKMVTLADESCSGGPHGQNPFHYQEYVQLSYSVVKELNDIKLAVAHGTKGSKQAPILDTASSQLQKMTDLIHGNCPGGAHGVDPNHYGEIVGLKDVSTGELAAAKVILRVM